MDENGVWSAYQDAERPTISKSDGNRTVELREEVYGTRHDHRIECEQFPVRTCPRTGGGPRLQRHRERPCGPPRRVSSTASDAPCSTTRRSSSRNSSSPIPAQ